MKKFGPFEYKTLNYGLLITFDKNFYLVKLNTKDTFKYSFYKEIGLFLKNPIEELSEDTFSIFLKKNEHMKFSYTDNYELSLNFSRKWKHFIKFSFNGLDHKFQITDRNNFDNYKNNLTEYFKEKLILNL